MPAVFAHEFGSRATDGEAEEQDREEGQTSPYMTLSDAPLAALGALLFVGELLGFRCQNLAGRIRVVLRDHKPHAAQGWRE